MRTLRSMLSGFIPATMTVSSLLQNIHQVCKDYGSIPRQDQAMTSPRDQQSHNSAESLSKLFPLTSIVNRVYMHPSTPGSTNSEIHWVIQQVFIDMSVKFIQSFIEQKLGLNAPVEFTLGNMMRTVAQSVFGITIPSAMHHTRVLLELNNCEFGVYETNTLVLAALKKLALIRWSHTLNRQYAPMGIELLFSAADCYEMAHRWNRYVCSLGMDASNQIMQFECEFQTLYIPTNQPAPSESMSSILYRVRSRQTHAVAASAASRPSSPTTPPMQRVPRLTLPASSHQKRPPDIKIARRSAKVLYLNEAKMRAEALVSKLSRAIVHATVAVAKSEKIETILEEDEREKTA